MSNRARGMRSCPFCGSLKLLCEGVANKRAAVVCQKCLAKGPEVNETGETTLKNAYMAWNGGIGKKFSKVECPVCKRTKPVSSCGLWPHINKETGLHCEGPKVYRQEQEDGE